MRRLPWDPANKVDKHDGGYHREQSNELYHTVRWTKLSKKFRANHPLCAECLRKGVLKESQCVDHIIPFPICNDFFDESNLQALCNECNMLKGIEDRAKIQQWKREHRGREGKSLEPVK